MQDTTTAHPTASGDKLRRIGMVARWKPVHIGHAAVLEGLLEAAEVAVIGVGSSNRYDLRNPFSAAETRAMLRLALGSRGGYEIVDVPDLDDGPRWSGLVAELFGPLDLFVSANPYVRSLMTPIYAVLHPVALVPPARRVALDGTAVRRAMARRDDGWRRLVPPLVASHLSETGLHARFLREFGAATLAVPAPRYGSERS